MAPDQTHPCATPVVDVPKFIDVITSAFQATALTTAFIAEIDETPPPYPSVSIDSARRRRHFSGKITDAANVNADLVQAGNWSAVALWEPPDFQGKPFAEAHQTSRPILTEWREKLKRAKRKYLAGDNGQIRPFYHLGFLARNPDVPKVAGALSAVILPFLRRARAEGVAAWLEATTPQAVGVYEHLGFRVVEKITIGSGKIDAEGWPKEGGEGVSGWCMIFDPHLT